MAALRRADVHTHTSSHPLTQTDKHRHAHSSCSEQWITTHCVSSLVPVCTAPPWPLSLPFSLPFCLPLFFMPPCCLVFPLSLPLLLFLAVHFPSPPARSSFISPHLLLFWLHLFRYISPFHSLSALSSRPPLLLFTPSVLALPPPLPPLLAPSHLRHTHLALPFIASGGWRATVSFNPSQCHLQTLTVTQRLHRCLTIKAVALSKAGRGVITAAAQQIEPRLIWLSAHK